MTKMTSAMAFTFKDGIMKLIAVEQRAMQIPKRLSLISEHHESSSDLLMQHIVDLPGYLKIRRDRISHEIFIHISKLHDSRVNPLRDLKLHSTGSKAALFGDRKLHT